MNIVCPGVGSMISPPRGGLEGKGPWEQSFLAAPGEAQESSYERVQISEQLE